MKKRDISVLVEMIEQLEKTYEGDLVRSVVGLEERPKIRLLVEAQERGFFRLDKCFKGRDEMGRDGLFTHVPSSAEDYQYREGCTYDDEPEVLVIPARGVGEFRTGKVFVSVFCDGKWLDVKDLVKERPLDIFD